MGSGIDDVIQMQRRTKAMRTRFLKVLTKEQGGSECEKALRTSMFQVRLR